MDVSGIGPPHPNIYDTSVIFKNVLKTCQNIRDLQFPCKELAVIESLAEVEHKLNIVYNYIILVLVRGLINLIFYAPHYVDYNIPLFLGHMKSLIKTIIKECIIVYLLFK